MVASNSWAPANKFVNTFNNVFIVKDKLGKKSKFVNTLQNIDADQEREIR